MAHYACFDRVFRTNQTDFFEEMGEVVDRLRFEMAEVIGPSAGD